MTPASLQEAMMCEIGSILNGMKFKNTKGERVDIEIYRQTLPLVEAQQQTKNEQQYEDQIVGGEEGQSKESDLYPFVLVRVENGGVEDLAKSEQFVECTLIIGIYDDDVKLQGYLDILNVIQKIIARFQKNTRIKNAEVKKIKWSIEDEEVEYPYFAGGMVIDFDISGYKREDDMC